MTRSDPLAPVIPPPQNETDPALFCGPKADILADLDCLSWQREMLADGSIHYPWISERTASTLGVPPEALTVSACGSLGVIHWADRENYLSSIHDSARSLSPCRIDFRVITAGDETRWMRESSRPHTAADGRIVWDGVWLDNTRSIRAEFHHQTLMDHAQDCIFILSDDDRVIWCNSAARREFTLSPNEGPGLPFADLIEPGAPSPVVLAAADPEAPSRSIDNEMMGRRRDGSRFPFEMTVSELRSDGRLSLIVIGRDITRRRDAERRLAESERRLRLTFVTAALGIVVVTMDGVIRFCNPAFESMASDGYSSLLGTNLRTFIPNELLPPPSRIPPAGMSFGLLCSPRLADGAERHWRMTGTRYPTAPDQTEPSLLFFIEDVTETTRIAHERRQLELLLHEGQKLEALGRLAGGIAHELNNMLGPILMGAEMIARTASLDERNAERCRRIIDASKNSREIVRNVLTYCRKESKVLGPVDLVRVFDDFTAMAASTLPPSIKVVRQREIDRATIIGDGGQLQQILLNLVNNARDAMEGHGTLTLSLIELDPAGLAALITAARERMVQKSVSDPPLNPLSALSPTAHYVKISISDTGDGMDAATIARIFDPFFTTKPVGQGTGLGLSVVQNLVKGMGGVISVESHPGSGSTFRIVLPVSEPNEAAATP
ncbi:ATP-binding protein [Magnetospirillum molischianum]|uniref:histidine kinase n=1 Tax=Magnetospirillum molischianum DSM 120 TaxID=1150626 RepID=H8FPG2_MAGML|nr:ATP-binding protein [Magnetospirillum molischianum]CCG40250.1 Putative two-component sensor histidine kinase, classical system [Magnetospirillum molischianum DSM 120]